MSEQVIEKPVETTADPKVAEESARKQREAEIKKRGAELKAEKDGLNKQRAQILAEQKALDGEKAEIAEFKRWRSQATMDPDAFLKPIYGETWRDTLAKHTTGDSTPLQIRQLREEWEKERKARAEQDAKTEADKKAGEEAAAKAKADDDEKTFQEYRQEISTKWITEHKDKFPSLASTGLAYAVADRVRAIHRETGKMPDELEVAKGLEEELDKVLDTVYTTPKWSEKLAAKFKAPPPVTRPKEAPQFQYKPKAPSGISQQMTAGTKPEERLTREERRARLVGLSDDDWNKRVGAARSLKTAADE